ncbi:hypothetical protein O3M35_009456 [Rhynocoris fuscipes]|uniref:Amine oxidase domain-containing protein n=1 Tax=Rhynocoris fuscipes TaxID=488301 RepID=A0AAW1D2Z1_9HEMI
MAWNHLLEILREVECIKKQTPTTQADLVENYIGIRIHQLLKKLPQHMAMTCARLLLGLTSYLNPSFRKVASDSFGAYAVAANMRVPLGYLGALAPIITEISPERILYKKQVLNIRWGTVTSDQHPRAVIKCKDGSVYNADYVVITIPLGVLKANVDNMFCPPISPNKVTAIKTLSVGHKAKIFMEFDQPMWVWRDKKIQYKWHEGDLSSRPDFTKSLISMEELNGSEHIIIATLKGDSVEDMEKLTDDEVSQIMTCFLMECLGDNSIPKPISIVKTNWTTNPNFRGSFSYVPSGASESEISPLRIPLPKGCNEIPSVLYFAGEHTCRPDLMGTVRGAMISGIREAEQVIAAINQSAFEQHPCELLASC